MKIIILGATGMLGFQVFKTYLKKGLNTHGVVRETNLLTEKLGDHVSSRLHLLSDIKDFNCLNRILIDLNPTHIINCIGIVKQSNLAENHIESITINSLLPHYLAKFCKSANAKLIHVSTDCVFDGSVGNYKESDFPSARDLYGRSKLLGEVGDDNSVTIRTSIIGHEISAKTHGLVEWFLGQSGEVKGFTNAFFSGLTTLELANLILDYVINKDMLAGVYHVSANRISKFDLINLLNKYYDKKIKIVPSSDFFIDRSLDSTLFKSLTGYSAPSWESLILNMKLDSISEI